MKDKELRNLARDDKELRNLARDFAKAAKYASKIAHDLVGELDDTNAHWLASAVNRCGDLSRILADGSSRASHLLDYKRKRNIRLTKGD